MMVNTKKCPFSHIPFRRSNRFLPRIKVVTHDLRRAPTSSDMRVTQKWFEKSLDKIEVYFGTNLKNRSSKRSYRCSERILIGYEIKGSKRLPSERDFN